MSKSYNENTKNNNANILQGVPNQFILQKGQTTGTMDPNNKPTEQ